MINRKDRMWLTIACGIVLLMLSDVTGVYAQENPVEFSGTWNTVTSKGKKIVVELKSVNRRLQVTGTYAVNGLTGSYRTADKSVNAFVMASFTNEPVMQSISSITGTVTGNVLRFKWVEDGGRGAGRFVLSQDGRSFQGTFSRTDNPDDTSGGTWNGTRQTNFYGVWQTKAGEQFLYPQLLLQQSGAAVTGHLFGGNPTLGVIKDGVVDGNTVRFTVWRPNPSSIPGRVPLPDIPMGKGELVMNPDGKSFKGTILGAAVNGTRLGR